MAKEKSLMASSLQRELEIQEKYWQLKEKCTELKYFDLLISNEFLPFEVQLARQRESLKRILSFSFKFVPYYQDLQKKMKLENGDSTFKFSDLPVLSRRNLQDHFKKLKTKALPGNDKIIGETKTSGSTGEPVKVLLTLQNMRMFGILKQRELRWFRWNPKEKLAAIRTENELRFTDKNTKFLNGARYCQHAGWPYVDNYFKTGSFYGFDLKKTVENQKIWLEHIKPTYLMMISARLEHLAMAYQNKQSAYYLKGLHAISQELTSEMRIRIESKMGIPVQQNYGINEIGLVAVRCPEAGRYHVHAEHCMVEIVNETGQPCDPGERGRLLVTGFNNFGMPLLRYDTGDWAELETTPCSCGRTLPSFGNIHGRYNSFLSLPEGVYNYYAVWHAAMDDMTEDLIKNLRQYQLYHFRDGSFELRLAVKEKLPAAFGETIYNAWDSLGDDPPPLKIIEVDSIPMPENGKFQMFTSDFFERSDE